MAPKKSPKSSNGTISAATGTRKQDHHDEKPTTSPPKKRKQDTKSSSPNKAPRRSARSAPKSQPSPTQLLTYLLSPPALSLAQPAVENETKSEDADKTSPRMYTTHATLLTPFEELVCAAILSRPISHRLGHRTIRTVLNPPYNFTTAKKVRDVGREKVGQALWDAKTQHKEKTATEIWDLANTVLDSYGERDEDGETLEGVRKSGGRDVERIRAELGKVKGIGKTGLDIFFRRLQWAWEEAYPFVDDKTAKALEGLGLSGDAQELSRLMEQNWDDLKSEESVKAIIGDSGDVEGRRKVFVVVLERAVGGTLEGNAGSLKEEAAKMEA